MTNETKELLKQAVKEHKKVIQNSYNKCGGKGVVSANMVSIINRLALACEDLRNSGNERTDLEFIKDNSISINELKQALGIANGELQNLGMDTY